MARDKLPYLEIINWANPQNGGGLYTKNSNELVLDNHLRTAENTDFFSTYGALSKPPGMSRILSSIYSESGTVKPISWVGFYKAPGLDGAILRHPLVAAGTIVHRVETDGTLSALTGSGFSITESRTSGLYHSSTQYLDKLYVVNQNPELIGQGDTPFKYDGTDIHRWGLLAPGKQGTVQETFSASGDWTTSQSSVSNESTITQDGDAVKMDKDGTGATNGYIQKTLSSTFSVSTDIADRAEVWLYIPRGQLVNFASSSAVSILIGSDANLSSNYYTFNTSIGALAEGWNQIKLDFSDPSSTTGTPVASALQTVQFGVNSVNASTTISNLRWDIFTTFDTGAVSIGEGAAGSVFASAGTWTYKVTYVNKYGHESNAGPVSTTLTASAALASLELTNIPTSSDSNQVVQRKIYRTVDGGSIWLLVTTIQDNTTTTYSDTTADTALGQTSPPEEGDLSDDNTEPPKLGFVKLWKRTIFGSGNPANPNAVYFTEDNEPESWPTLNIVLLDERVTGFYETYSGLVVETETGKWQVSGDNPDFRFDKLVNQIGNVGHRGAGDTRLYGWATDRDGMRLYDLNETIKISEAIRDKFDGSFNKTNIENLHTTHSRNRNSIILMVQDSNGQYLSDNYLYQYPIDDLARGWWWQLVLPSSVDVQHIQEIEDANGDFKLYAGAADGMLYELFDSSAKNWIDANGDKQTMTTKAVTKWYRLGARQEALEQQGASGRASPRLLEARHAGDATTWSVLVEMANGPDPTTVVDSATVSLVFGDNESLIRAPVPVIQPAEYVRLTFTNSDQDVSSALLAFRLYYFVQPGQFPVLTGDLGG